MVEKKLLFPIVTADVALFTLQEQRLRVLLIQRANKPTPGGRRSCIGRRQGFRFEVASLDALQA